MSIILAIEIREELSYPLIPDDVYESRCDAFLLSESNKWSRFISSSTWGERHARLKDDVLCGRVSEFNESLVNDYPSSLRYYTDILRALEPVLQSSEVGVLFYSDEPAGRVTHSCWEKNELIQLARGELTASGIQQTILEFSNRTRHAPPFGMWDTLLSHDLTTSRILVIGTTLGHRTVSGSTLSFVDSLLALPSKLPFISFLLVGKALETEEIQSLQDFVCACGGLAFSGIMDPSALADAVECTSRFFLMAGESELHQRSDYINGDTARRKSRGSGLVDDRCEDAALWLIPGTVTSRSLFEDSSQLEWRWTRGLRIYRELRRGVRDVVYTEPGPLGLELSPPTAGTPYWTLACTHPPISGIGLKVGALLIAIGSHSITKDTSRYKLHQLMAVRPVCITFHTPEEPKWRISRRDAWICSMAEEMASAVLANRVKSPYKTVPPPFRRPSGQRPWQAVSQTHVDQMTEALVIAAASSCDVEVFDALSCCNTVLRKLLRVRRERPLSLGMRVLRYIVRRSNPDQMETSPAILRRALTCAEPDYVGADFRLRVAYGISLADIVPHSRGIFMPSAFLQIGHDDMKTFMALVDAITPACFTSSPLVTKQLKIEGVPLELMFIDMVLRISLSCDTSSKIVKGLYAIYMVEGCCSIMWVRIFLVLVKRIHLDNGKDFLSVALGHLSLDSVSEAILLEALYHDVNQKWLKDWSVQEFI